MVAGERERDIVARDDLARVIDDRARLERADRQDRRLRRVDDRGEAALTPNMPRFDTVKVPPPSSGGVIAPARTRSASARVSRAISPSDFSSASNTVGTTSASVGRHRDADVDARVQLQAPVAVAAVGRRVLAQRQRARLDDHVVVGRRRPRRPRGASLLRAAAAQRARTSPCRPRSASVKSGIVAFDSAIRRAIVCCSARQLDLGGRRPWRSPTRLRGGAAAAGAPLRRPPARGAGRAAAAASTSALTIRPPGPLPRERAQVDAALARRCAGQRRGLDALARRRRSARRRRAGAARAARGAVRAGAPPGAARVARRVGAPRPAPSPVPAVPPSGRGVADARDQRADRQRVALGGDQLSTPSWSDS